MAKNGKPNDGRRNGAVKNRSQVQNPQTGLFAKRDSNTGQFLSVKVTGGKYKGIRNEN